jgi:RNA polymerase sigma-70 factor (ECF subfamily)
MDVSVAQITFGIPVTGDRTADRETAFGRLMTDELDRVLRLASMILGSAVDAEDAVHDAAIIAWRKFDALHDSARFPAWFDRILVNVCRDRLRTQRRSNVVVLVPGMHETRKLTASGDDAAQAYADRQTVHGALLDLNPDQQVALALRYGADLTVPVIAARLGIAEGTVKSRLHHALRSLRAAIDAEDRR